MASKYATRELSEETLSDLEEFFSEVHGCACTLYIFGRHLPKVASTARERADLLGEAPDRSKKHFPNRELMRARELAAVGEEVRRGTVHGILVYSGRRPVGWCHFGRVNELPVDSEHSNRSSTYARNASTEWVINCFTTRKGHRRQGVASAALEAAVAAIKVRGGGWVEAVPMALPHDDPNVRRLRRAHGARSPEIAAYMSERWPNKNVPGIGQLNACQVTGQSMAHMGNMSMFEKAGFAPVRRDEQRSSASPYHPADFVVMRLHA